MRRTSQGFTLIEVSLFLAISGLLLIGIIAGTQSSIVAQRFNDSTQNFMEFLRALYSEVENPQGPGDGRSNYAIYGKLASFGQTTALDGTAIPSNEQRIYVYDLIGDSSSTGTGSMVSMLGSLNANVVIENKGKTGNTESVTMAGNVKEYSPTWGAAIDAAENGTLYTGTILVVRHPRSGTISTLVSPEVIQINENVRVANATKNFGTVRSMLKNKLSTFETKQTDFCINPNGVRTKSDNRRDIRLVNNARNASGVDLVNMDSADNKCTK